MNFSDSCIMSIMDALCNLLALLMCMWKYVSYLLISLSHLITYSLELMLEALCNLSTSDAYVEMSGLGYLLISLRHLIIYSLELMLESVIIVTQLSS